MDKLSPERRSANMRAIRSESTKPEMLVRKLAHGLGYRYRLHRKDLPGKPDLVFASRRKVIFVHGCFWHQHPNTQCKDARPPRSNLDYWQPKLARNVARDGENQKALKLQGWQTIVIWECETRGPDEIKRRLEDFLSPR